MNFVSNVIRIEFVPIRAIRAKIFPPMTTANKITILRILLIPFFVVELIYYVRTGNEIHRLLAIFRLPSPQFCDGVDGYIARHYNQISELGKILDPLADKLLLVSGIVALSFDNAPYFRANPALAHGNNHRARLAAFSSAWSSCSSPSAKSRCIRVSPAKLRRCFKWSRSAGFCCAGICHSRSLSENLDSGRWDFHRRFRTALRLGRNETARRASGQFGNGKK